MLTEGQKTNNAICVASNGSAAGHHCSERAAGFILWKRQERLKFEKTEDCPPPTVRLTGSLAFLHKSDVLSPKTTTHAPRQKWIERKIRCRRNRLRVRVLSFFWSFVFLFSKNALEKYGQDRMVDVEHSLQKKKYFDE